MSTNKFVVLLRGGSPAVMGDACEGKKDGEAEQPGNCSVEEPTRQDESKLDGASADDDSPIVHQSKDGETAQPGNCAVDESTRSDESKLDGASADDDSPIVHLTDKGDTRAHEATPESLYVTRGHTWAREVSPNSLSDTEMGRIQAYEASPKTSSATKTGRIRARDASPNNSKIIEKGQARTHKAIPVHVNNNEILNYVNHNLSGREFDALPFHVKNAMVPDISTDKSDELFMRKIAAFSDDGELDIRMTSAVSYSDERRVNLALMLNHEKMIESQQLDQYIDHLFALYTPEDMIVYKPSLIGTWIATLRAGDSINCNALDAETMRYGCIEARNGIQDKKRIIVFQMDLHFFVVVIGSDHIPTVYDSLNEPYITDYAKRSNINNIMRIVDDQVSLTNIRFAAVAMQVGGITCGVHAAYNIDMIIQNNKEVSHLCRRDVVDYRDEMARALYSDLSWYEIMSALQKKQFSYCYQAKCTRRPLMASNHANVVDDSTASTLTNLPMSSNDHGNFPTSEHSNDFAFSNPLDEYNNYTESMRGHYEISKSALLSLIPKRFMSEDILNAVIYVFTDRGYHRDFYDAMSLDQSIVEQDEYLSSLAGKEPLLHLHSHLFVNSSNVKYSRDVYLYKYVALPICYGDHWTLCIYEPGEMGKHDNAYYYDSLAPTSRPLKHIMKRIRAVWNDVRDEHEIQEHKELIINFPRIPAEMRLVQNDAVNCGAYVIMNLFSHMFGHDLTKKDPNEFRMYLKECIMNSVFISVKDVGEPVMGYENMKKMWEEQVAKPNTVVMVKREVEEVEDDDYPDQYKFDFPNNFHSDTMLTVCAKKSFDQLANTNNNISPVRKRSNPNTRGLGQIPSHGADIVFSNDEPKHDIPKRIKRSPTTSINKPTSPSPMKLSVNAISQERIFADNSGSRPYNTFDEPCDQMEAIVNNIENQLKIVDVPLSESSVDKCLEMLIEQLGLFDVVVAKTAVSVLFASPETINKSDLTGVHMKSLFTQGIGDVDKSDYKLLISIRDPKLHNHFAVAIYYKKQNVIRLCDPYESSKMGKCNIHLDEIVKNVVKVFEKDASFRVCQTVRHLKCYQSKGYIHNGLLAIKFAEALLTNKSVKFADFKASQYKLYLWTMHEIAAMRSTAHTEVHNAQHSLTDARENNNKKSTVLSYLHVLKEESLKSLNIEKGIKSARNKTLPLNKNSIFTSIHHFITLTKGKRYVLCDTDIASNVIGEADTSNEKRILLFPINDICRTNHWVLATYSHPERNLSIYDCNKHVTISDYSSIITSIATICSRCFETDVANMIVDIVDCSQTAAGDKRSSPIIVCLQAWQILNSRHIKLNIPTYPVMRNKLIDLLSHDAASCNINEGTGHARESTPTSIRAARSRSTTPSAIKEPDFVKALRSSKYMTPNNMEKICYEMVRLCPHPNKVLIAQMSVFYRQKKVEKMTPDAIGKLFVNYNVNLLPSVALVAMVIPETRKNTADKNKHYYFAGYDVIKNECVICDTSSLGTIDEYTFVQKLTVHIAVTLFNKTENVSFKLVAVDEGAKNDPTSSQIYAMQFLETFINMSENFPSKCEVEEVRSTLASKLTVPYTPRTADMHTRLQNVSLTTPNSSEVNINTPRSTDTPRRKVVRPRNYHAGAPLTPPRNPHNLRFIQLYYSSMKTLDGCEWLSGEVIMASMQILAADFRSIHVVDTTEFPIYCETRFTRDQKWKLSETTDILVPIHTGNHWMLCHVEIDRATGMIYDSMNNVSQELHSNIIAFVNTITNRRVVVNVADPSQTTKQRDLYNCGVITIFHAEQILNGQPTKVDSFDAAHYRAYIQRLIADCPYVRIVNEPSVPLSDTDTDTDSLSNISTPTTRKSLRRNNNGNTVNTVINTVSAEDRDIFKFLRSMGWNTPTSDCGPAQQFQLRMQSIGSLRKKEIVEPIVLDIALNVLALLYKKSSVIVVSPSDVDHYFEHQQLNSSLLKQANGLNGSTIFAPYILDRKWRLAVFFHGGHDWEITCYHPDGFAMKKEEDMVISLCAKLTSTTHNRCMSYYRSTDMACSSDSLGTASALYFNAKRHLEDDLNKRDISAYTDRACRDEMAKDIIQSGVVSIIGVPSGEDLSLPTPLPVPAQVNYTAPDAAVVDTTCLNLTLFQTEVTEQVFELFVSKLARDSDYVALPLAAHTAAGPLEGFTTRLQQGLLIPIKNNDASYALAVVKGQRATLYSMNLRHTPAEISGTVSELARWYNKQRARLSLCKQYPKGLVQKNMLLYIAALMYSYTKYSANYVYNVNPSMVKEVMRCVVQAQQVIAPLQDPTRPDWQYLDAICRKPMSHRANAQGTFSDYEEQVPNSTYRRQRKNKVTEDIMRASRDKPLPDLFVLPQQVPCEHCGAFYFNGYETPSVCCKSGAIDLKDKFPLTVPTEAMRKLKEGVHNSTSTAPYTLFPSINRENAFAHRVVSFMPRSKFPRGGLIPLVLNGEYLVAPVSLEPCPDNTTTKRFTCLNITNSGTVEQYEIWHTGKWTDHDKNEASHYGSEYRKALMNTHPFYDVFKTANELLQEEKAKAENEGRKLMNFLINIIDPCDKREFDDAKIKAKVRNAHNGTLNAPATEQIIAYIYQFEDGEHPSHDELNKGIRVYLRSRNTVSHVSSIRDQALFPLLFPTAARSYHRELLKKPSKRKLDNVLPRTQISRAEFHNYTRCRRGNPKDLNHWLLGYGAVTAEYELQTYTQIEADRFAYYQKIELEMANKIITTKKAYDTFTRKKLAQLGYEVGVKLELSKQYPGSKKNLEERYYAGCALARAFGKPDIFLTFTGNPYWKEIEEMKLSDKEDWQHTPDEVVRVFHAKLKELQCDLFERHVLGKIKYAVTSLEFQKRGMPHAHLILKRETPLSTPEAIDAIISAEIPALPDESSSDYELISNYRELLKKHMIHGPCENSTTMGCRKGWTSMTCKKKYPKKFNDATEIVENDYPNYKRPDNDQRIIFNKHSSVTVATNQHVVPHNPYLLTKYGCHINLEAITGVMNFRYIFKYIYKGLDELLIYTKDIEQLQDKGVTIRHEKDHDGNVRKVVDFNEMDAFRSARYLSQHEACYRRRGYRLSYTTHKVMPCWVHLEGEHYKMLDRNDDEAERDKKMSFSTSKFLQYMVLMRKSPQYKNLTFLQVCERFRYVKSKFVAYQRTGQIEKNLAYLVPVHPSDMNKYSLYALVRERKGYESYEDLKTDPTTGITYGSFEEVARAMKIIEDDREWEKCIDLCKSTGTPYAVRTLYATLLSNCNVPNARGMWDNYKQYMIDADKYQKFTVHQREQSALRHIKAMLKSHNKKYKMYNLPEIEVDLDLERKVKEEAVRASQEKVLKMEPMLNDQQKLLAKDILDTLLNPNDTKRLFILTGSGGCGKTFLYEYLIHWCIANNKNVIPVASTGIAATLLHNGLTAHTAFNIPINIDTQKTPRVNVAKGRGKLIAAADIVIWDEAPMTRLACFDYVEKTIIAASTEEQKMHPFGGRVVLLGGDWKQILPIVKGDDCAAVLRETINNSDLFPLFRQYKLTQNMRLDAKQVQYKAWIERIGRGRTNEDRHVKISENLLVNSVDELIEHTFPENMRLLQDYEAMSKRAILAVRNDTVLQVNEQIFNLMPGKEEVFKAITKPLDPISNMGMPIDDLDLIESLSPPELPLHVLKLKVGSVVMLLRNIDLINKLCNGTKLAIIRVIRDKETTVLECINLTDPERRTVFIPRIQLNYENTMDGTCFSRRQFPVKLCYAMTFNKSQGQTMEGEGLLMNKPVFSHGHLYTGVSRVRGEESIRIYAPDEDCKSIDSSGKEVTHLRNIVFTDLFDRVGDTEPSQDNPNCSVYGVNSEQLFSDMGTDDEAETQAQEISNESFRIDDPNQNCIDQALQNIISLISQQENEDADLDSPPPQKRFKSDSGLPTVHSPHNDIPMDYENDDAWDEISDDDVDNADTNVNEDDIFVDNDHINPVEDVGEVSTDSDSDLEYEECDDTDL